MKRSGLFLLAVAAACSGLFANEKEKKEDNFEFTHNRFSFSGMLTSSDTYQLEAAYHYMFNRYVGIGGAFGYWKVYYETGWASGTGWEIESDDNRPFNLYLHPSVVLKTPAISIKSVHLGLFAEPGLMLNVPYTRVCIHQTANWPEMDYKYISTSKGQWLAMDLRAGIYANFGPCGFSAGYLMSNLDVYSQYRHLSYNGVSFRKFYPKKTFLQGAYLTLSYYF